MVEARIIVVCGHYGSGKTNLSVNLALQLAAGGHKTAVVDLDIVNPYFRTADFGPLFAESGVELIAPRFANSNLDIPILPPRLASAIGEADTRLVIDVGGDDDGAVALGGFAQRIAAQGYQMLYVVNQSRFLEEGLEEELALLEGVRQASRLEITGLVNNTNLGPETTPELILASVDYLQSLSERSGIPVLYTAAEAALCPWLTAIPGLLPIQVYVKKPWE